jgi:hypothetical protein
MDPVTGTVCRGAGEEARLRPGDLLLVDLCRYRDYAERDGQRQPAMVRLLA